MTRFINKLSEIVAKNAFVLFVLLYSFANIFFTVRQFNIGDNRANYQFGIDAIHIVLLICILCLFYIVVKLNINRKQNLVFLSIFCLIATMLGLYWIFTNHQILIELDDAYNCFRAASLIGQGDYGPLGYKSYINTYPHNLTLVSYFMIFTRMFGDGATTILRVINLAFVIIGYVALYGICDISFRNEKINTVMIMLMFMSMQYVFYAFFVYGNAISYSTGMISIYFFLKYLKEDKLSLLIISMLAVVISAAIKNNSLIILFAEVIYLFLRLINNKKYILILITIVTIVCFWFASSGITKFWETRSGNDYSNKLPRICWIAYGLNYDERHPGGYMNEFESYHHENGFVPEFTEERAKRFIDGVVERFEEKPSLAMKFYAQKFLVSFANPEYETFAQYRTLPQSELNQQIISGDINDALNYIWDVASTLVSIGCLVYVIKRYKEITLFELLCGVVVFGGFLFHCFWETKAVYLYQYYLLLLPYAACGLSKLLYRKEN